MEAAQFPAVHWTPHDDQHLMPKNMPGGGCKPIHVPQPSPNEFPRPESQQQFDSPDPASNQWPDLLAPQSFMRPQDPNLLDKPSDGFVFHLNETPSLWDWTFGDLESLQTISLFQAPTNNSMDPQADHRKDDNPPVKADAPPISSQDHGYLASGSDTICQECAVQFTTKASLNLHTKETQHTPYRCRCNAAFTRLDVLDRHIQVFGSDVSIACPYCHKTPKSFSRQDHLTQHLRGFHSMDLIAGISDHQPRPPRRLKKQLFCSHDDCWDLEDLDNPPSPSQRRRRSFQSQSHYTTHLREVHDESLFPCMAVGCARKGGKGFFRNRDLVKHRRDHHSRSTH